MFLKRRSEMKIKLAEIKAATPRVRKELNLDKLDELSDSIKETGGVIVPIKVRKNGKGYTCVYGHRRIEATRMAGLKTIEAFVADVDDAELLTQALIENVVREDMQPIDVAKAFQQIKLENEWTNAQVGARFGMTKESVTGYLGMLKPEVKKTLEKGNARNLTHIHLREAKAGTDDDTSAVAVLEKAAEEGLSTRQTRTVAEEYTETKKEYGPKAANQVLKTPYSEMGLKTFVPKSKPDKRTRTPQEIEPKVVVFQWVKDSNIIRAGNLLGRMASDIEDLIGIAVYMKVNKDKETKQLKVVAKSMRRHIDKRIFELERLLGNIKEL